MITRFMSPYQLNPLDVNPLRAPQGAQFVAKDRVRAGRALVDPTDMQGGGSEVDLLPP
jgi:hypothetical protein